MSALCIAVAVAAAMVGACLGFLAAALLAAARREDEAEERLRLWHDPPPPVDVLDPRDEERDHLGR
jgi:hypothetical protein